MSAVEDDALDVRREGVKSQDAADVGARHFLVLCQLGDIFTAPGFKQFFPAPCAHESADQAHIGLQADGHALVRGAFRRNDQAADALAFELYWNTDCQCAVHAVVSMRIL